MSDKNTSEFSFDALIENIKSSEPELKPTVAITQEEAKLYCSHQHAVIDETKRTLNCEKCGIELNQFDFILQLARNERQSLNDNKELRRINQDMRELNFKLGNESRNLKAQVKRAQERLKLVNAEILGRSLLLGNVELEPCNIKEKSNSAAVCLSAVRNILK